MATAHKIFEVFEGVESVDTVSLVLIGSGPAGDPSAYRRLVHPDGEDFPPLVYASNPDRTINLDNAVLPAPLVSSQMTLTSTRVTRFERGIEDTICQEIWSADRSRASMTVAQFRLLYELFLNPPEFDPALPAWLVWEPRDRTDRVYNVELLLLTCGGNDSAAAFDVRPLYAKGGLYDGGDVSAPLDHFDTVRTGLLDREVRLTMRVVSEVT